MTQTQCPGCGAKLTSDENKPDKDFYATTACRKYMYELSYFTLSHTDPYFIHQLAVDAYAAQHIGPYVKPVAQTFSLVGLYLVEEKGFTGKQVQQAHIAMAKQSKIWPIFTPPTTKHWITVNEIVALLDDKKEEMIHKWTSSVWQAWQHEHYKVANLAKKYLDITI